ncbi:2OG-Fe(II) oxygenase, partial [Bradyrhizobium sp. HKCCYLS2038]
MNRRQYGDLIAQRLLAERQRMKADFQAHPIQSCFIDNLLPEEEVAGIFRSFPAGRDMPLKRNLREFKFASAQMNKHAPILEEIIYAFQEPGVVAEVAEITGIKGLQPDTHLYAGGISMMAKDHFLNPHLDNSHDKNR